MIGLKCEGCGSYNTSRSGNEEIPTESAEEDDAEEVESDGLYNDDHVRLALLQQRLGALIRQWEQPTGEERNEDNDDENERNERQQNMLHSFVDQLLFQGMLDEFSGQYGDSENDKSENYSEQSNSSHSGSDSDDEHERSNEWESDTAIADFNSDDDQDADDEDDSSNDSLPSYSYFSQPHPINLNDIYASDDGESCGEDADSNDSWETEEEQELIGEVGDTNNWGDTHYVQRQVNDITTLSGSLGSVRIECQSGWYVCLSVRIV